MEHEISTKDEAANIGNVLLAAVILGKDTSGQDIIPIRKELVVKQMHTLIAMAQDGDG